MMLLLIVFVHTLDILKGSLIRAPVDLLCTDRVFSGYLWEPFKVASDGFWGFRPLSTVWVCTS
jgi:hypothetical protein